jgi:TonB family protein
LSEIRYDETSSETSQTMKSRTLFTRAVYRASTLAIIAAFLCAVPAFAEESACKSKSGSIRIVYPDLARRMKISGTVRLQLQLTSSGSVREVKVLGGNPVLVSAAQDAVKQAKFEGPESCVLTFEFKE